MLIAKIYNYNKLNKIEIFKNSKAILFYQDKMINDNTFERIIRFNYYIYIMENSKYKLDLFKVIKPVQFIELKKLDVMERFKPNILFFFYLFFF